MVATIAVGNWNAVRTALRDSAERFAGLIESCDPDAMATKDWSVADTAAHVTSIAWLDTALVQPEETRRPGPWSQVEDRIRTTTVDKVNLLNDAVMERFTERDPHVLARQLRAHTDEMLRVSAALPADSPVPWLGGWRLSLAGKFAHLANELQIHGRDIADAVGTRWVTPPAYAAQFLEFFVFDAARNGSGQMLYRGGLAPGRRIAVEFLSRYTAPITLVMQDGTVSAGQQGAPVDVRLRFDPVTMNLMLFSRITRLRAALQGKVMVSGRRPWLLLPFWRALRLPS